MQERILSIRSNIRSIVHSSGKVMQYAVLINVVLPIFPQVHFFLQDDKGQSSTNLKRVQTAKMFAQQEMLTFSVKFKSSAERAEKESKLKRLLITLRHLSRGYPAKLASFHVSPSPVDGWKLCGTSHPMGGVEMGDD